MDKDKDSTRRVKILAVLESERALRRKDQKKKRVKSESSFTVKKIFG